MNLTDTTPRTEVPAWFLRALSARREHGSLRVDGARIHYQLWGDGPGAPIVLLHGSGANSAWWEHLAPHLAGRRRVAALDLSGHGDSDRRERYDYPRWIEEVRTLVETIASGFGAAIVGHSFGGAVALAAQHRYPHLFTSVTTVDSPLRVMSASEWKAKTDRATRALKVYARRKDAVRAFRTVPAQVVPEYLREHVASRSVVRTGGGWTWKFDPRVFDRPQFDPATLRPSPVPVTIIRSEDGSMTEATSNALALRLGRRAREICIPAARHHVMFDQPVALVAGLQALFCHDETNEVTLRHRAR